MHPAAFYNLLWYNAEVFARPKIVTCSPVVHKTQLGSGFCMAVMVCCCRHVTIATREVSEWADNGGREEKATVRKTPAKKEGHSSFLDFYASANIVAGGILFSECSCMRAVICVW